MQRHYIATVTRPAPARSHGSRTAACLVAGALATVPALLVLVAVFGTYVALGAVVVMWTTGVVWLLKRRQDDPAWESTTRARKRHST
jgi:hypothetical protein